MPTAPDQVESALGKGWCKRFLSFFPKEAYKPKSRIKGDDKPSRIKGRRRIATGGVQPIQLVRLCHKQMRFLGDLFPKCLVVDCWVERGGPWCLGGGRALILPYMFPYSLYWFEWTKSEELMSRRVAPSRAAMLTRNPTRYEMVYPSRSAIFLFLQLRVMGRIV